MIFYDEPDDGKYKYRCNSCDYTMFYDRKYRRGLYCPSCNSGRLSLTQKDYWADKVYKDKTQIKVRPKLNIIKTDNTVKELHKNNTNELYNRILQVKVPVFIDYTKRRFIFNKDWTMDELMNGKDIGIVLLAMLDSTYTLKIMPISELIELQDKGYTDCIDELVYKAKREYGIDIEIIELITRDDILSNANQYAQVLGVE